MKVRWSGCWVAPLSWVLAGIALAQSPNYDAFLDRNGNITTEAQHAAAIALVQDARQLEIVYQEAAKGNVRARRVWQELEANMAGAGVGVAERATQPGCLVPGYKELEKECRPNWSFLDFLSQENPGALQLRKVLFSAFAAKAHERGIENQVILATVNGLLSVGVAAAVLREAEAAAAASVAKGQFQGPPAVTGGRGGARLKPDPSAQGPHSTFKRDPRTGEVTGHAEWQPNQRNPAGFDQTKRVDVKGDPHFNKATGKDVPTPHVHEKSEPGGVRPARPDEVPR